MGRQKIIRAGQWPAWLSATALLIASWLAIAAMTLQARTGSEAVAVLFPPWWSARQAFSAAASARAAIIRITAVPALVIVRPDGDEGLLQLRDAGAWLVMDPQAVASCLKSDDVGTRNDDRRR